MAIKTGEYLNTKDIYIDYPYEEVMFRRTCSNGLIYRKFYGKNENPVPINDDNKLFNEALLSGHEITQEEYNKGKIRK
jgi:hypothetical protein